jgi:ParB family transcriptional regulator, chromosome partitioning protein
MAKKIFGVSNTLSRGIRDTLTAVENNINNFRFNIVHLSQIELDSDNPRDLLLTINDVKNGLELTDPHYARKKIEVESLRTLANTIQLKGLINPIVLYKFEKKYRLVAGERRYLAAHIAKKEDIQARILSEKPSEFDVRLLQWIENNERQDLILSERLNNIRSIANAYKNHFQSSSMTASIISRVIGLSLPQATYYYQVLHAPSDVLLAIENNEIKNLDKAAAISSITSEDVRQRAIDLCRQGATLKQLKALSVLNKDMTINRKAKNRERTRQKVNLGATNNINVVKTIIQQVLKLPEFKDETEKFHNLNFTGYNEATHAFNQLLNMLEQKIS